MAVHESWRNEMRAATEALRESSDAGGQAFLSSVVRDARFQMDALVGQFRAAVQLAGDASRGIAGPGATRESAAVAHAYRRAAGQSDCQSYLQSAVFRHAIRLSCAVTTAELLARNLETPRAYWLPMTAVVVLKPEFTVTFTRGLLRIAGTITGLLLATVMFHFLPPGVGLEVVLIAGFVFLLRWIGPANYGIFGVAVSALVVLLISFTGVAPKDVIWLRGINTVVGGRWRWRPTRCGPRGNARRWG